MLLHIVSYWLKRVLVGTVLNAGKVDVIPVFQSPWSTVHDCWEIMERDLGMDFYLRDCIYTHRPSKLTFDTQGQQTYIMRKDPFRNKKEMLLQFRSPEESLRSRQVLALNPKALNPRP